MRIRKESPRMPPLKSEGHPRLRRLTEARYYVTGGAGVCPALVARAVLVALRGVLLVALPCVVLVLVLPCPCCRLCAWLCAWLCVCVLWPCFSLHFSFLLVTRHCVALAYGVKDTWELC